MQALAVCQALAGDGRRGFLPSIAVRVAERASLQRSGDTGVMAVEHGVCGSWKSVRRAIAGDLPGCSALEELKPLVRAMDATRARWDAEVLVEVSACLHELRQRIPSIEASVQGTCDAAWRRVAPESERLKATIRRLESTPFFLLRWWNRCQRVPPLRAQLARLMQEPDRAAASLKHSLRDASAELERITADPQAEAGRRLANREARLARLQGVLASAEYVGAEAECGMSHRLLRGLPDGWHVFHDVNVEQERWSYQNGKHRRSAQIDHVVVGPGGVFVLETKRWSQAFASAGRYYDPYEQVEWAARLLYRLLNDGGRRKIKVREIIASHGALPPKPADSYAKVLPPGEVCGYIRWFKPELDDSTRAAVVAELTRLC